MPIKNHISVLLLSTLGFSSYAEQPKELELELEPKTKNQLRFESCLFSSIKNSDKSTTLAQIEQHCENEVAKKIIERDDGKNIELGALSHRLIKETRSASDPYIMTPHKMNYILPALLTDGINQEAYKTHDNWYGNLEDIEAKFQLSIKIPLLANDLLVEGDQLFFGFTIESWWQMYSDKISKPFRETNYNPEFFYLAPIGFHPFGGNSAIVLGIEHQSNGRSQDLSRSWNRVYITYLYEKRNFALSFKPWYRIPENEKATPKSSNGDDNPDILDYMGHFELGMAYKFSKDYELSFKGRENFSHHRRFVEVGITFPLWGKLRGYAQYSNGYGESLIDYNYNQQRLGIGIALTTFL
ncbi:phospholipase A [Colwellia sp. D2M02]|uniref:phospholipase A n=1 Tax=Colwellia sp. D2M02 TaxID=2841562 RepID=UPI001C0A14A1|nr:phospholipase A [Colwellia sp. D2M02]MBU2895082.1 phospholipase A [Colwellia sp. D2M02]